MCNILETGTDQAICKYASASTAASLTLLSTERDLGEHWEPVRRETV